MSARSTETDLGSSPVTLTINGRRAVLDAAPGERLLDALRRAGFVEVKEGCGEGECGSCTVLLDGHAVCACLTLAQSADGGELLTVAATGEPRVDTLRQAMVEEMGTQCGFCTPGMVLSAAELLHDTPRPDDEQIKDALAGNLCRCTGYTRIAQAVHRASSLLEQQKMDAQGKEKTS
ncbi:MAG: (2Fe-2S)-binding protein [Pseudomonadota bacterium]